MNFSHTEDRRMLAATLDRFVRERYGFETRQRAAGSPRGFDPAIRGQLVELGALGVLFPEQAGGYGGAGFDIQVVFEAIGRGLVVEPLLPVVMAGHALLAATAQAPHRTLEGVVNGESLVVMAHAEPEGRYDMAHVATRANRTASGWTLTGTKGMVLAAEAADAFVVSARTSGGTGSPDGISLFLVPAGTQGLRVAGYPLIDGGRAAEVVLDNVQVKADAIVGEEGSAMPAIETGMAAGTLALTAEALGAMEVARDHTLDYLRTRKQFGVPIGSFQALQHRMVDVLIEIEQARSAVINAAAAFDGDRLARERAISAAKFTVGRVGTLVAEEAIQLHGGIGMTWELPLSHYAKRLVMIGHQCGDEDHHLARYLSLGRPPASPEGRTRTRTTEAHS